MLLPVGLLVLPLCLHTFLVVRVCSDSVERDRFEVRPTRAQGHLRRRVDTVFELPEHAGALGREGFGHRVHLVVEFSGRDAPRDKAKLRGLFAAYHLARQHHVERFRQPDPLLKHRGREVVHDPQSDLGLPELGVRRRDRDVGVEHEVEPAPERVAVDAGHRGLPEVHHRLEQLLPAVGERLECEVVVDDLLQIAAGTERVTRALEDNDPNRVVVLVRAHLLDDRAFGRHLHGVERLGSIQFDSRDSVLDGEVCVDHGRWSDAPIVVVTSPEKAKTVADEPLT